MLRMIIVALFLGIFGLVSLPTFFVLWLIGKFSMNLRHHASYAFVRSALKILLNLSDTELIVKGEENLIKDRPVLYVGNHRSFFDIVIAYSIIPPLAGFISKIEVKKVPILRTWMTFMNCLYLDRNNAKEGLKTILAAIEQVKSGISIFIFPEGTRSKADDAMIAFKEGSLKIAQKTNCPVIPVAFNNTSAIFEDQKPFIKKAKVIVEFGKPIYLSSLEGDDKKFPGKYTHDIVEKMVLDNMKELGE